jgi:hypothetical protein
VRVGEVARHRLEQRDEGGAVARRSRQRLEVRQDLRPIDARALEIGVVQAQQLGELLPSFHGIERRCCA